MRVTALPLSSYVRLGNQTLWPRSHSPSEADDREAACQQAPRYRVHDRSGFRSTQVSTAARARAPIIGWFVRWEVSVALRPF